MKKFIFFAIACVAIFAFTSCKPTSNIGDTFSGTCFVTYCSSDPDITVTMTLNFNDGKFSILDFLHNQAEFSGDYSINDDKIKFDIKVWKTNYIDKNGHGVAYDFDTYVVPQGEYNCTFDGNELKFSKTYVDYAHYEWVFIKN